MSLCKSAFNNSLLAFVANSLSTCPTIWLSCPWNLKKESPAELDLSVEDTIKVYINGVKYSKNYYTFSYPTATTLRIEFNEGLLGFPIETNDEIHIAGKFQLV